jgi:hypothetical protein
LKSTPAAFSTSTRRLTRRRLAAGPLQDDRSKATLLPGGKGRGRGTTDTDSQSPGPGSRQSGLTVKRKYAAAAPLPRPDSARGSGAGETTSRGDRDNPPAPAPGQERCLTLRACAAKLAPAEQNDFGTRSSVDPDLDRQPYLMAILAPDAHLPPGLRLGRDLPRRGGFHLDPSSDARASHHHRDCANEAVFRSPSLN